MENKTNNFVNLFKTVYNGLAVYFNYDPTTGKFVLVFYSKQKSSFNKRQVAYYFDLEDMGNLIRLLEMVMHALENQKKAIERRNDFLNGEIDEIEF